MQKYEVSNYWNSSSEQIYPIKIDKVEYVDFIDDKKFPYGCIQIHCLTLDGYYCTSLLKCYLSKKGKFAIWGKHRIYVGYRGAIELIGVPLSTRDTIKLFAEKYGTICS